MIWWGKKAGVSGLLVSLTRSVSSLGTGRSCHHQHLTLLQQVPTIISASRQQGWLGKTAAPSDSRSQSLYPKNSFWWGWRNQEGTVWAMKTVWFTTLTYLEICSWASYCGLCKCGERACSFPHQEKPVSKYCSSQKTLVLFNVEEKYQSTKNLPSNVIIA